MSVRVAEDVVFQNIGRETILLDMKTGRYYALNSVGSRVWELLVEKHKLSAVLEVMLDEYDVSPEDLQRDVVRLVREMQAKGLVTLECQG